MSTTVQEHRAQSPNHVAAAVITISDTRTIENDTSGHTIADSLKQAGHQVLAWEIVPDEPERIRELISRLQKLPNLDAILITGGTGIGSRDQTFETLSPLLTKTLPGFGELFRMLSYPEIGAAAMLSRAIGGLIRPHGSASNARLNRRRPAGNGKAHSAGNRPSGARSSPLNQLVWSGF